MSAPQSQYFNEGYYHRAERGGFPSYEYESQTMQEQLRFKLDSIRQSRLPHRTILFVGCAKGFEVAYFNSCAFFMECKGVDISEYAIQNALPAAKPFVQIYDGLHLPFGDKSFEMVAAFDCMALVEHKDGLAKEMTRVAKHGIFVRVTILPWRLDPNAEQHGTDGVPFKLSTLDFWDKAFSQDRFRLINAQINCTSRERYESLLSFASEGRP